ncbi:DUF551 domain-containing protein [Eikenella halliae]|uniref:DUF551 domain-containing protein n=1 Tax=Eikenella halliae TaxID=1795832 RepID=UPI0028D5F81B|nr:DUF551 domain-containing protein [Eikenella halliae]
MTPERIEQERQLFEAWISNPAPPLPIDHCQKQKDGRYAYDHIEFAWRAWQAKAAQSAWISVEDRMPEKEGYYLTCAIGCAVRVCRFDGKNFSYWEYDEEEWEDIEVTYFPDYWQPIPTAPTTNPAA